MIGSFSIKPESMAFDCRRWRRSKLSSIGVGTLVEIIIRKQAGTLALTATINTISRRHEKGKNKEEQTGKDVFYSARLKI